MEELLKNKKVEKKLSFAFTCTLGILVAAIIIAVVCITLMNNDMKNFYGKAYANSTVSMEIRKDLQYTGKLVLWSMTTDDLQKTGEYLDQAASTADTLTANVNKLINTYDDTEITKTLSENFTKLTTVRESLIDYAKDNINDKALEIYNGEWTEVVDALQDALIEITEHSDEEAVSMYTSARTIGIICTVIMIFVGIMGILMSIKMKKTIVKVLMKPIDELDAAMEQLKNGNLTVKIAYKANDELGNLAANFESTCLTLHEIIDDVSYLLGEIADGKLDIQTDNVDSYIGEFKAIIVAMRKLRINLNTTLFKINEASEQVAAGAEQMADNAQVLAEGATEQAGAVEELTATIEDVSSMSGTIANEAEEAYSSVLGTVDQAAKSKEDLITLTNAMEAIDTTSKEIQKIIATIEDIASQTNLLSLNASIEAARAGEGGRGFAVVANQIGKLASDSAQSAVTTRELIEKSLVEVQNGNEITKKTVDALNEILNMMSEFAETSKKSSEVSRNQAQMLEQIEKGIEQISSVVQNNSASAEETSATSEELSAQSENLKGLVNKFRLSNNLNESYIV